MLLAHCHLVRLDMSLIERFLSKGGLDRLQLLFGYASGGKFVAEVHGKSGAPGKVIKEDFVGSRAGC